MSDDRDVVVHVDIAAAVAIEQVGALAAHNLDGLVVKQLCACAKRLVPTLL